MHRSKTNSYDLAHISDEEADIEMDGLLRPDEPLDAPVVRNWSPLCICLIMTCVVMVLFSILISSR